MKLWKGEGYLRFGPIVTIEEKITRGMKVSSPFAARYVGNSGEKAL
jgi:hypothetical protein